MASIPRIAITAAEEKYKDIDTQASGTPGFEKYERGGLDKVRDFLGSSQAWGYHSVPSSIAPLLVLDRAAKDWSKSNARGDEANWDNNLDAWLGTICAYLFYGKTGQKLCLTHNDVEAWPNGKRPVDNRPNVDKRVCPEQSYIRALRQAGRKPMIEASGETGEIWRFTYLNVKQSDKLYRIALLDEQLMLVPLPLEPETQRIMKNLKWYIAKDDGSGGQMDDWSQVTRFLFKNYPVYGQLLLSLLNKLIDEDLADDTTEYPKKHFIRLRNFINKHVVEPEDAMAIQKRTYISLSSVWIAELPSAEVRPSFYDAFLKNVPESGVPSEEEIWTENAVLLPLADIQATALEENFWCAPVQATQAGVVDGRKLYLLPPLKEEIYNYLIEHNVKSELRLSHNEGLDLTVTITFNDDDGMRHESRRVYSLGKTKTLWLLDSLPYLSLWPNVNLPADAWKLYYIFRSCAASSGSPMQTLLNAIVTREDTRRQLDLTHYQKSKRHLKADDIVISVDDNPGLPVPSAFFADSTMPENGPFTVYKTETRPKMIELKSADERTFANLRLKTGPPLTEIFPTKKATLSLDFGTSATLLYFKTDTDAEPRSIESGSNYVLDLIPFQNEQNRGNFDRFHGVLTGKLRQGLGKINSVAQNNEYEKPINRNDVRPYVQGRYILLDHIVWSNIKKRNDDKLDANPELPPEALHLDKYGIYSGLKFPGKNDNIEKITEALYVFFSNLLVLAALHARLEGVFKVSIRVACPHQAAHNNLASVLQPVLNDSNENYFGNLFYSEFQAYEEARAVCAYLREYRPSNSRLNNALGAVIVDIGGGTTDVCVVKDDKTETFSFGLAGDRLIRRSIVYSTTKDAWDEQREFRPGNIELRQILSQTAPGDESGENLKHYLSAYESIVQRQGSNESSQEKIYYKDLAELVDIVMQRYPPRYDRVTNPNTLKAFGYAEATAANALTCLADTIKLRYMLQFYLLGAYLKQKAESLSLKNWNEVRIYLAGFGSRGLGFCCGRTIVDDTIESGVSRLAFFKVLERVVQKAAGISVPVLFIPPTDNDKYEVVKGLQANLDNLPPMEDPLPDEADVLTLQPTEREQVQNEAELVRGQIKKDLDDVLANIKKAGHTNPELANLREFCDHFTGLLDKSDVWAGSSATWTEKHQIENALDDACVARFSREMLPVGLAVSYFNLLIDAATRKWGA